MSVCAWIVVIGAPLSHAVFRKRRRDAWPFLAPAVGIVTVLLVTNLSAYVAPGAASAWFGLLAPTVLSAVVAWRSRLLYEVSLRSAVSLLLLAVASAAFFLFALINRIQVWFVDWAWHFSLINRMARGAFPPVTPFGPDSGIGYHYGSNLIAASFVNVADLPVWMALYSIQAFFVVILLLVAVGLAIGFRVPRPFAWGSALALIFFPGQFLIGLPISRDWSPDGSDAIHWLVAAPHTLAVTLVLLVAAKLESGRSKRHAVTLAGAAGAFALAETGVLVFSGVALALIGTFYLTRMSSLQRAAFGGGFIVAAALMALAGGPISDLLFDRGGTAGMARIELNASELDVTLLRLETNLLLKVGIIPLAMVSSFASVRLRSWGLGYLSACAITGLAAAALVQSPLDRNDGRILWLASAVALVALAIAIGAFIGRLKGRWAYWPVLAVCLAAICSIGLPRAVIAAKLTTSGYPVWCVTDAEFKSCHLGQNRLPSSIERDWDFYVWLSDSLPNTARLLTPEPAATASISGVASPTSGGDLQALAAYSTPVYDDAIRFLFRDDLSDMHITHLHVTEESSDSMSREARGLLSDRRQFRLVADRKGASGKRHRIYKVVPGAGTAGSHPSSFRMLRQEVPVDDPISLTESLTRHQRGSLLFLFVDSKDVRAPSSRFLDRATRIPRYGPNLESPQSGFVFLPDAVEPTPLNLSRSDALWAGYGIRGYDLSSRWSSTWRIASGFQVMPEPMREHCESNNGRFDLRVLGNEGTEIVAGSDLLELTGLPQSVSIELSSCDSPLFYLHDDNDAPLAQFRKASDGPSIDRPTAVGSLGYGGAVEGNMAIVDIRYRNPSRSLLSLGSEFRLYRSGPSGTSSRESNPESSLRWWLAPLVLQLENQSVRVRFDAERLEINGVSGAGSGGDLEPGSSYLLTLNVTGANPSDGTLDMQLQVPLVRVSVEGTRVKYHVLSGIVAIEDGHLGESGGKWREGIAIG